MKSNLKRRILAFMLCMVMVLSSTTSVLADDANAGNTDSVGENQNINNEPAAISEEADSTEQTQSEPKETAADIEDDQENPQIQQPEAEVTQPSEPTAETQKPDEQPVVTESTPVQEALELKQDMKDADGNVNCTVTANIPKGTFAGANTSDVTMEVKEVEAKTVEEIKGLIEKDLAEGKVLGGYFLYKISFKVNGETVEPGREIKITFEKKNFKIDDTTKATVFYYNEAYSAAGNETAEIKEIIQKSDKLEELQNAGQSTENIEDFDLTEISLKEDGTADKIQTEGRRSTVYGCYIEEEKPEEAKPEEAAGEENAPAEEEPSVYQMDVDISISDKVLEDGSLTAECSLKNVVRYTWLKSDSENGDYKEVEKVEYQGNLSNISKDGKKLYPTYDNGARKWYKVKVTLDDGTMQTSNPQQVRYYGSLQNGSFEIPQIANGNISDHTQLSNANYKNQGGVWQTTGTHGGQDIEIIRAVNGGNANIKKSYSWNGVMAAVDGKQFAELNCQAAGALYQDVLTYSGQSLNWWLSHRARGSKQNSTPEYDTMYLVIMPTSVAMTAGNNNSELDTQAELKNYLRSKGINIDADYKKVESQKVSTDSEDGVYVYRITSNDQSWNSIKRLSDYTAAASLTRFFFVAGKTASGNNTVGNFLDEVGFSQELPPVNDNEFSIEILKKFKGLDNSGLEKVRNNIKFQINAIDKKTGKELNEEEKTELFGISIINGTDMIVRVDGSLYYSMANRLIRDDSQYQVTITEINADLSEYEMTSNVKTTVMHNGESNVSTEDAVIETLQGKTSVTVEYTNSYDRAETKDINFTKVWDDADNKFNTRPASLDVILKASIVVEENGSTIEKALDEYTQTATLRETNEWKTSWKVPVYYDYNGTKVKINYMVEEGEIDSSYVYKSPSNGVAQPGTGEEYRGSDFSDVRTESEPQPNLRNHMAPLSSLSIVHSNGVAATANSFDSGLGEPAHNKYIEYKEKGLTTDTYEANDVGGSDTYPMPIVQVTTHELSYIKEWKQPANIENPTNDVILHVVYTDGTRNTITLSAANGYKYTEKVPVTKNISSITEEPIEGYTASYQITDGGTNAIITNSYSKVTKSTITVKKVWEGGTTRNPITVTLWQSANDGFATCYDTQILSDANGWEYTWRDLPLNHGSTDGEIVYTYAVREENAPANYSSNITYDFKEDKTVATIKNTYDPNCADEDYYIVNVLQTENITLKKEWNDEDNILNKRPSSLGIKVSDGNPENDLIFYLNGLSSFWEKTVKLLKKTGVTYTAEELLDSASESYELESMDTVVSENGTTFSFVNKLKTTSIVVHKEWNDGNLETRPQSISFTLKHRENEDSLWKIYDTYTMTSENVENDEAWTMLIDNLPATYEYKVEEINVADGYNTKVTNSDNTYTITNTLNWKAIKTSTPIGSKEAVPLSGAEFELRQGTTVIANGVSGTEGVIEWTLLNGSTINLKELDGEYTIHETKAPDGYVLSGDWILTFEKGLLVSATLDGESVAYSSDSTNGVMISLTNDAVYELPHTGGLGIYWYSIGGMLLMIAAALILYKIKCREVLKG